MNGCDIKDHVPYCCSFQLGGDCDHYHKVSPNCTTCMFNHLGKCVNVAAIQEAAAYNKKVDDDFASGRMLKAPCFVCGYNGEGYFQPEKHICAEQHHALWKENKCKD